MQLKYSLIYVLFLFLGNFSEEETLTWSETHKLTWEDFKAKPDPYSNAVALTASGITFGYSVKTSDEKIVNFSTTVEAHFYPRKSWYLKDKCNDYILRHEQLHFDITELYARKFRAQITKLFVSQDVKNQFQKLHISINDELDETQKRYDEESKHSMDVKAQMKWETFILEELGKLENYKSQ